MNRLFIVCASVAYVIVASGCSSGGAGLPTPSDPFGNDSASTSGSEPTIGKPEPGAGGADPVPGSGGTIEALCARACVHIQASCPGNAGGSACAADCAESAVEDFPTCMAEFRAFVVCIGTARLTCSGTSVEAPTCQSAIEAVILCSGAF
jgi:hypothetical protein